MRRVTRPGGSVAACTWDGEGGFELSSAFWEEVYKLDSVAKKKRVKTHLFKKGQFTELWDSAGLNNVEETALEFLMGFTSFDDYWLPFLQGATPMGTYVKDLTPEDRDALREALRKRFLPSGEDGPFSLGSRAWAVRGTVPE